MKFPQYLNPPLIPKRMSEDKVSAIIDEVCEIDMSKCKIAVIIQKICEIPLDQWDNKTIAANPQTWYRSMLIVLFRNGFPDGSVSVSIQLYDEKANLITFQSSKKISDFYNQVSAYLNEQTKIKSELEYANKIDKIYNDLI